MREVKVTLPIGGKVSDGNEVWEYLGYSNEKTPPKTPMGGYELFRIQGTDAVDLFTRSDVLQFGIPESMCCHGRCQDLTIGMLKGNTITCTVCLHSDVYDAEHAKPTPLQDEMLEVLKLFADAAKRLSIHAKPVSINAPEPQVSAWAKLGDAQAKADKVIKRAEKELRGTTQKQPVEVHP